MRNVLSRIVPVVFLGFFFLAFLPSAFSQTITIKGKITDSNSGDPIPFVNILLKGTSVGTTTDFDGNYTVKTTLSSDSLVASYIGYRSKSKAVTREANQTINFQLEENVTNLQEIVVLSGENPAFEILRRVVRNKSENDKRKLSAYEYDTYTKIEIDVDNISEKLREKKIMKKIAQVLDSVDRLAGEDGKPILPMFISESVSKFYFRDNPQLKYEHILKTKISGVGVEDGTLVTQLVGSSFQEYNFYQNWLNILGKDFVSPIADGWRIYYEYDLTDSLYVGGEYCYRLDFFPKSPQDLAFTGTVWITKADYALKQVDATVGKQANLNFIEKIKIQQELEATEEGAWLPVKNRVLIDVGELTNTSAGMLAKFYTSNKNFVVNKPRDPVFYKHPIVMAEDARLNEDEDHWDTLRHEPLSESERNVYKMIDTLQNIPIVKTYIDIIKIVVDGYYDAGKIYIGPYVGLLAYNNIEGLRIQSGFKTSIDFSNKWVLRGQLGYGFGDQKVKYSGSIQHILSRERWTTLTFRARSDIGRVGIDDEILSDNFLFLAAQRWGNFRRGYYYDESRLNFQRELFRGFTQRVAFKYLTFRPTFNFGYISQGEGSSSDTLSNYETAELIIESRFARDELFIQDDNDRISLGTSKWPIVTLRYTRGFKGVIDSDFDYTKLRMSVYKRIRVGPLGTGYLNVTGEYTFGAVPYPLLSPHIGNETPIYTSVTFNLMDFGEFVSDRYAALQYQHHFEGFLLNRIPLMRKLKWRLVGSFNMIYGGMTSENQALIPVDEDKYMPVGFLEHNKPYIEMGYGVENIFKFFRVDFVHRLSYLDNPDTRKFGILFSFHFNL
ncbi:MAG TPA: DUF5686 family protein [Ohtaekwangia sp.]